MDPALFLNGLYERTTLFVTLILLLAIWEAIWKGFALWHSARNKQLGWFIIILIVNTVGILPIVYLILARPKTKQQRKESLRVEIIEDEEERSLLEEKNVVKKKSAKKKTV
ncbi:MAG: DUF5652 family protein [archaeon]|nr:DUF5652 family protein [archaeon]